MVRIRKFAFYDVYFEFIEHFLQIQSSLDMTRPLLTALIWL